MASWAEIESGSAGALPYVDEHAVEVAAGREPTWEALLKVVEASFGGAGVERVAAALGCQPSRADGPRPLAAGSTIPGFRVLAAGGEELRLAGRHRFSAYALVFRLDPAGAGTRLRAETRAAFPGLAGRAYRALVIGTRMHVVVVRRVLAASKRRAERA